MKRHPFEHLHPIQMYAMKCQRDFDFADLIDRKSSIPSLTFALFFKKKYECDHIWSSKMSDSFIE